MISQLSRAACALLVYFAAQAGLAAAEPPPSSGQADAVRRLYLQALQKGDFAAAGRYETELKALEARGNPGGVALTALPASGPVDTFFSAPAGTPGAAPAASSTVFTPPDLASPAFTSPTTLSPRTPEALVPATKKSLPASAAVTPAKPATTGTPTFVPVNPAPTLTNVPAVPALTPEEPRPTDVPPAVLELRAAQAELS